METDWTITWLAPLMPEAAMIPEGDVFRKSSHQHYSLVAGQNNHTPGLLFSTPDILTTVARQAQEAQAAPSFAGSKERTVVEIETATVDASSEDAGETTLEQEAQDLQGLQDFTAFLDLETGAFI
ncbi:hypothetical protein KDH_54190 [Dictyobacter sp. S3.2.2.5]|uniref:Uncharacterized protein n=1 Tax=Dictyobacter halimunensis TaxID=3026934 RepID=A0ABQ6FY17_9CHLR|nr:hypothetical protein KDH_54190 [Dictyobacter sp. S3.2.2.5]